MKLDKTMPAEQPLDATARSGAPDISPRTFWIAAAALLVVALGLRLFRLGQPDLWGDEILFLNMCGPELPVKEVVDWHISTFHVVGHLPATSVLNNIVFHLLSVPHTHDMSPFVARLTAVLLGMGSLGLLAAWVTTVTGRRFSGLLALAVGTLSFAHWWYSREAYYYAGLLFFATLVLLSSAKLLSPPASGPSRGRRIAWAAALLLGVVGMTFSHGSGVALGIPVGLYALVVAIVRARRRWEPWLIAAATIGAAVWFVSIAGTGQAKAPWIDTYRFGIPAVAADIFEFMGLGPGWGRIVVSFMLAGLGVWAAIRMAPRSARGWLAVGLAVFLAVHLGGSKQAYHPRYFLLFLPFLTWWLASGFEFLAERLPVRFRTAGVAAVVLLLAANVAPGLSLAYRMNAKRDAHATLSRTLDEKLPPGTICLWEGGHAQRFVPGFHRPKQPFVFGAIPDGSPDAYLRGGVKAWMEAAKKAFPSVAYIEWMGMSPWFNIQKAGPSRPPESFRRELEQTIGHRIVLGDPAQAEVMRRRWGPIGVPRLAPDAAARLASNVECATMNLYYSAEAGKSPAVVPEPGQWQAVFAREGAPLLIAPPDAAMRAMSPTPFKAVVGLVGFAPGALAVRVGNGAARVLEINQPGRPEQLELDLPAGDATPVQWSFRSRGNPIPQGQAAFGVTGWTVQSGAPAESSK